MLSDKVPGAGASERFGKKLTDASALTPPACRSAVARDSTRRLPPPAADGAKERRLERGHCARGRRSEGEGRGGSSVNEKGKKLASRREGGGGLVQPECTNGSSSGQPAARTCPLSPLPTIRRPRPAARRLPPPAGGPLPTARRVSSVLWGRGAGDGGRDQWERNTVGGGGMHRK